mmetsp:Transcript_98765/g.159224  ORF Transcript_98765/g.159224 Transcript_98765/m.159224 type:complete len:311 (+) Transcript_98765:101-1033(+)
MMDDQTMLLAGGVTAVVAVAVTAMWAAENMGSKAMSQEEKRERGRKNDRGKKASQMKPKKEAAQDAPAQRAAAPPAAPPPAPKTAAAPAAPAGGKDEGKKKGKKGGKEEAAVAAPPAAAAPVKKKKAKAEAMVSGGDTKKDNEKEKKKADKAAQMQADTSDGWCHVGKTGKPKESAMAAAAPAAAAAAADTSMYMGVADNSAAFFEVPVGAGGDFLQASVAPSTTSGSGAVASAQAGGKKKDKAKVHAADLHTGNGWSPSTDEVATTVARDLATMTIAPSPVKKVVTEEVTEDEDWATVPVKTKKKSAKA